MRLAESAAMRQAERERGTPRRVAPPLVRRLTPTAPPAPHPFAFPTAGALGRSSPLPPGEGGRVRIDELERLRALAQEAVDEGGLPGPIRPGEEDEGGHGGRLAPSVTEGERVEQSACSRFPSPRFQAGLPPRIGYRPMVGDSVGWPLTN